MAFAARASSSSTPSNGHGSNAGLGAPIKFKANTLTLAAQYVCPGREKTSSGKSWSESLHVILLPFTTQAAEQRVPHVMTEDTHESVPLYTVDPEGRWLDINVGHGTLKDPTGRTYPNSQITIMLDLYWKLDKPHRLLAQQHVNVNVKGTDIRPKQPLLKIAVYNVTADLFLPPLKPNRPPPVPLLFLHAGGFLTDNACAGWPLIPRLRDALPYERQMLPTRAELYSDSAYKPATLAHLAQPEVWLKFDKDRKEREAQLKNLSAPAPQAPAPESLATDGGPSVGANEADDERHVLAPVRIEVNAFQPWAGGAYVLPSEAYTLVGATNQGLDASALILPKWSAPGREMKTQQGGPVVGPDGQTQYYRPRFGGALQLGITLARALDAPVEQQQTYKIAAEVAFYQERLVNAPSYLPPLLDAITLGSSERPPVPFTLVAGVRHDVSLREGRTNDKAPDGILSLTLVQSPLFRMREYLERYAIPVSEVLTLNGRFDKGKNTSRYTPNDRLDDWYNASIGYRDLDKALVRYDLPGNADGCLLMDLCMGDLPDADRWPEGTRFYVQPLVDKAAGRPLPLEADPTDVDAERVKMPADMRPKRCALRTTEAGDAYVLAELLALKRVTFEEMQAARKKLDADASDTDALAKLLAEKPGRIFPDAPTYAVQGHKVTLPYFCFWAVTPLTPEAATAVAQPVLQPSRVQRTTPAVKRPATEAPAGEPEAKRVAVASPVKPSLKDEEDDDDDDEEGELMEDFDPNV